MPVTVVALAQVVPPSRDLSIAKPVTSRVSISSISHVISVSRNVLLAVSWMLVGSG